MDKERIRNRRERLRGQNEQLSSIQLKLSTLTDSLDYIYAKLEIGEKPEVNAGHEMRKERDELKLIADRLTELAKFISTTAGGVGYDADDIINASKSTRDKQ